MKSTKQTDDLKIKREYLSQIRRIDKLITANLDERNRLREMSTTISSPGTDGERVRKSRSTGSKHEEIVVRLCDLEREIDRATDTYVDLKEQAYKSIHSVRNNDEKLILIYRYIEGRTWESISEELFASPRSIHYWHDEALKNFKMPKNPIKI